MNTTPWSEAEYFRASRRARRAWEHSQPQLQLVGVLDETDVVSGRKLTSVSSSAPSVGDPATALLGASGGDGALTIPAGGRDYSPSPTPAGSTYERAGRTSFGGVRGLPDWRTV